MVTALTGRLRLLSSRGNKEVDWRHGSFSNSHLRENYVNFGITGDFSDMYSILMSFMSLNNRGEFYVAE